VLGQLGVHLTSSCHHRISAQFTHLTAKVTLYVRPAVVRQSRQPDTTRKKPGPHGPIFVANMSSNILSRKILINTFSTIFFGAQKNLGSTGITVVIIKEEFPTAAFCGFHETTSSTYSPSNSRGLNLLVREIVSIIH
jgi:hypothetical protein